MQIKLFDNNGKLVSKTDTDIENIAVALDQLCRLPKVKSYVIDKDGLVKIYKKGVESYHIGKRLGGTLNNGGTEYYLRACSNDKTYSVYICDKTGLYTRGVEIKNVRRIVKAQDKYLLYHDDDGTLGQPYELQYHTIASIKKNLYLEVQRYERSVLKLPEKDLFAGRQYMIYKQTPDGKKDFVISFFAIGWQHWTWLYMDKRANKVDWVR